MDEIEGWRKKIDEIDLKLLKLLNRRSRCAIEIGKIKQELNMEIYDPKREKEVIRNVKNATNGPLMKEAVARLFERIIDESRRAERETRIREKREKREKSRKTRQHPSTKARKHDITKNIEGVKSHGYRHETKHHGKTD
ncbi:chorismate mutase [Acidobacteria bacterium AH-259-L09]|nr:chorismate mutase [Acidobacteria bacterium AH-259-L09]